MKQLTRLFDHMAWADRRTMAALQTPVEPQEQALRLFAHLLAAEHVWIRRIQQRQSDHAIWPQLSFTEMEQLANDNHDAYRTLLASSNEEQLRAPVQYTNSSGQHFSTPLLDILLHVTHHGMYHRGQIALLVRQAGGAPSATDYIVFVRE